MTDAAGRVEVRAAVHADIPDVLALWAQSGAHPTITDDAHGVAALIADAPGALLLAIVSETTAGTVIAGWNGWRGSIYRVAVHPAHRRLGVAATLLGAAVTRLESLGARRIDAFVVRDDDLARSFWDSLPPPWRVDPLDKLRYVHSH